MYTWHVDKTEKFRYPINDAILKRRKELVKTLLVTLLEKSSSKIIIKSMAYVQSQNFYCWSCLFNLL